ncbi:MAG: helicase-related protein, partial [Turicibacter sp.]
LPSGHRIYKDKPNAHLKIKKNISDYIVEIAPEDIFVPHYKVYKIYYTPPEIFYNYYEKIGDLEYLMLYNQGDPMEAGVIMFKKHQFISGGFYDKEKEFIRIHYFRLKVICTILKKIKNENCIIFYNFLFEKELLLKTPFKNDIECYDSGRDPVKNILLLPIKSCSHGLNLQQYKNVMFFSMTHSSESFIQAVSRVVRNGQENDVKIFIPLCTHTLDIKIYNRIKKANSIAVKEFNSVLKLFD